MKGQNKLIIKAFLENELETSFRTEEIDWECDFIEAGYLDSLALYKLLVFIEVNLKIKLPIADLVANMPRSFSEIFERIIEGQSA